MDQNRTTGARSRKRLLPRLAIAGVIALLLAGLQSGVAGAHGWYGNTIVVYPGQSIQAAVNQAHSGDTIRLTAGTWTEAVCIDHKGVNIVGAGADATKITWPQWTTPANQAPAPAAGNACWQAWNASDPESNPSTLNDDVSGLFFLAPDRPVYVAGLSTYNHPANGIVVEKGNGVAVDHTTGHAHDRYGVLASDSSNIMISQNREYGLDRGTATAPNSGTAGVGVSDSAQANARLTGNYSQGWNLGLFVRESRTGVISGNTVTGNCVGMNLFDDSNTEVPANPNSTIQAGNWQVVGNTSVANHRFCLAGIGTVAGQLRVSGTGVAVVNMDNVLIKNNVIQNNGPSVPPPYDFPPSGLVLLTLLVFNLPNGVPPDVAGPVYNVAVVGNTITGNSFFDILMGPPPGTPPAAPLAPVTQQANHIVFSGNTCGTSYPPGTAGCGS
jgi:hypothetical protein